MASVCVLAAFLAVFWITALLLPGESSRIEVVVIALPTMFGIGMLGEWWHQWLGTGVVIGFHVGFPLFLAFMWRRQSAELQRGAAREKAGVRAAETGEPETPS